MTVATNLKYSNEGIVTDSEKTIDNYIKTKHLDLITYILLYKEHKDIFPKVSGSRVLDDVEVMDELLDYMKDLSTKDDATLEDLYRLRKRFQVFLNHSKLEDKI